MGFIIQPINLGSKVQTSQQLKLFSESACIKYLIVKEKHKAKTDKHRENSMVNLICWLPTKHMNINSLIYILKTKSVLAACN